MALVIPHQSNQGIQTASGGSGGTYRSAADYITPGQAALPGAIQALGASVTQIGGIIANEELRKRNEAQNLELIRDMQTLQADSQAFNDNFRQQYQGRDAIGAEGSAAKFHNERLDAVRSKWAGNNNALAVIERQGASIANAGIDAMRDYGGRQLEAFRDSTFAADKELFTGVMGNLASSPEEMGAAYAAFRPRYEAYLQSKGLDERAARIETARVFRDASDKRTESAFLAALQNSDIAGARVELSRMKGLDAADFAAQFETGSAGSLAIGYDTVGGTSYGKYQLSSKSGSVDAFIAWAKKNGYADVAAALKDSGNADTGSRKGKMVDTWRTLAASGAITEEMQDAFITDANVTPTLSGLPPALQDAAEGDPAYMRAVFSTAVQHGPGKAKRLITKAWEGSEGNREAFLDSLYEARKGQFPSSTPEVQQAIAMRMDRERGMVDVGSSIRPDVIARHEKALAVKQYSIGCKAMSPDVAIDWAVQNIEDGEVQASVIAEQRQRVSLEEFQSRRDRNARLETAYDTIRAATTPREAQDVIDSFPPEEQAKLATVAQRHFSGELTITDKSKMGEFITRLANGDTNINLKAEYGDSFSDMDMAKAEKDLASAERQTRLISTKALFDVSAQKVGLTNKTERAEALAIYRDRVDREGADTSEKKRKILYDMFRTVRETGLVFDTDMHAYRAQRNAAKDKLTPEQTARKIQEVPEKEVVISPGVRQEVIKALGLRGMEATEENIRLLFFANREEQGWL